MKLKIHTQILVAIVLAIPVGLLLGEHARHIKIAGDIFIRLLKMIILPLIITSMVSGIASLGNFRSLGRIGLKTAAYYLTTTLLAVTIGLILVNLLKPGAAVSLGTQTAALPTVHTAPSTISIIHDIVPSNLFKSLADDKFLSAIFFSLLFGVALASIGEKAKAVTRLFDTLKEVILRITDWIMCLAPIGVFALMAYTIGQMGLEVLKPLTKYILTVILGLAVHACIILPILLSVFARRSPLKFIRDMFSAVATAFSTASSAATLPITMDCLEKKAGVSNKVASFVLPLGATINMDGTALYEAVAAMFIAQVYGIDMTIGQQIVIMLTATLASIGAAAIPGAGLVTLIIVLRAVNLPLEGIAMILAVDRILDMCRTAVNVWGDACGGAVVARLEHEPPGEK